MSAPAGVRHERAGWTYCPACRMHVPDPIYAEFCTPLEDSDA